MREKNGVVKRTEVLSVADFPRPLSHDYFLLKVQNIGIM